MSLTGSNLELSRIAHRAMDVAVSTLTGFGDPKVWSKGPNDLVTDADEAVEETVRSFLGDETPEIAFLGEESGPHGSHGSHEVSWVLDPLDGTVNFSRGLPAFAIALSLVDSRGAVVAEICAPRFGERFVASRGKGSTCNGERILVSETISLNDSIACLDDFSPHVNRTKTRVALFSALSPAVMRVRSTGSASIDLSWLAAGRVDAVIMLSNQPWDTAAGVLIAQEAGAEIMDIGGNPFSPVSESLLAASPEIAKALLRVVDSAS